MKYSILKDLKPLEFFCWFGEICAIPHGSKKEENLVEFIVNFLTERNLDYSLDFKGNIFVRLPASKGYENQPSILFQAHLDMVTVKDEGIVFDFEKDPLSLRIVDNKLYASGTSLGADNGVGIATMLALLDSKTIVHPTLEFLFTVDEETGLNGIKEFDTDKISARRMINMDCGDSHVIAVSSTGKLGGNIAKTFLVNSKKQDYCTLKLIIDGGLGGHSSLSVRNGRACAVTLLAEILSSVLDCEIELSSIKTKGVAIFKGLEAVISCHKNQKAKVINVLTESFNKIKIIFENTDPNIALTILEENSLINPISAQQTKSVVNLLSLIKTAPYREDGENNSILLTFTVLQSVSLENGNFSLEFFVRSTIDYDIISLFNYYNRFSALLGFEINKGTSYVGWKETKRSIFREKAIAVHKKLFNYEPSFERVQGGIETAVIVSKIKDMDAIGFAPTARGAHTTSECIFLNETQDFWAWLIALLKEKE